MCSIFRQTFPELRPVVAPSQNEDREEIGKASLANTMSLQEQIQPVKMASSWNEDWEEDMIGLPAEQLWQ